MLKNYLWVSKSELNGRNLGLDMVRCIAITAVVFCHILLLSNKAYLKNIAFFLGVYGVEIFFVLSGFLIGGILLKVIDFDNKKVFKQIERFWIRRWFRTIPNYFLFLLVYILFSQIYFLPIPYHRLPVYLFFLQSAFTHNQEFYGVSWSLTIEEWFYFLFPIALFVCAAVFNQQKPQIFILAIIIFCVVPLVLRSVVSIVMHKAWDDGFRKQMPLRLDGIATGVAMAIIKNQSTFMWVKYKLKLFIVGLSFLSGLSLILYCCLLKPGLTNGNFFLNTFFFTFCNIAFGMLLPFMQSFENISSQRLKDCITYLSIISYSIYLAHPIVIYLMYYYLDGKVNLFIITLLIWPVIIIIASINYNLFEKKMTILRERYAK
jgi:peptidoglycan/LPS O-acetylase OafA/YrhL